LSKKGLKEVNDENCKSISSLYPIDYQEKVWNTARSFHNQGSLDHAQVDKSLIIKTLQASFKNFFAAAFFICTTICTTNIFLKSAQIMVV